MRFLIRSRCGGKTTAMVQWLNNYPTGTLVVSDENSVKHVRLEYVKKFHHQLTRHRVLSYRQLAHVQENRPDGPVAIDNLDLMLDDLLGTLGQIDVVTATGEMI